MELKAKSITTPVGDFQAPLSPGFEAKLSECTTNIDLFEMVTENGFINPDALNEVLARGLYGEYLVWDSGLDKLEDSEDVKYVSPFEYELTRIANPDELPKLRKYTQLQLRAKEYMDTKGQLDQVIGTHEINEE